MGVFYFQGLVPLACVSEKTIQVIFPHALSSQVTGVNWDGVWNLVLACPDCNRGEGGKFARIPAPEYLRRLNRRNEYLVGSHHPLRETLITQTGRRRRRAGNT